jgi:hypothetical protein
MLTYDTGKPLLPLVPAPVRPKIWSSPGRRVLAWLLVLSSCALAACASGDFDVLEKGRALGNMTAAEVLGIVCVGLTIALAYKDRKVYDRLEKALEKNATALQEVKDSNYADAITRAELVKAVDHCRAVQEERNRANATSAAISPR